MPPAAAQNNLYVTFLNIHVLSLSWKRRASVRLKLCPGPNPVENRMFLNVTPDIHTNALNITDYHFKHTTAFLLASDGFYMTSQSWGSNYGHRL
jgi:hypothetical protein